MMELINNPYYLMAYNYAPMQVIKGRKQGKIFTNLQNPPKKHKRFNKVKTKKF